MVDRSSQIEFFKKAAKSLLKDVRAGEPDGFIRAEAVYKDLRPVQFDHFVEQFGLMRAQHVVAVESGWSKWGDLIEASPEDLQRAIEGRRQPSPVEPPLKAVRTEVYGPESGWWQVVPETGGMFVGLVAMNISRHGWSVDDGNLRHIYRGSFNVCPPDRRRGDDATALFVYQNRYLAEERLLRNRTDPCC